MSSDSDRFANEETQAAQPRTVSTVCCWNCGLDQFDAQVCSRCGVDLLARPARTARPVRQAPQPRVEAPAEVKADYMLRSLESSGSPVWLFWIPRVAVIGLLLAGLWAIADDPSRIRKWLSISNHKIEITKIEVSIAVPYRILSIEGKTFRHPPTGHRDLMLEFDDEANTSLIREIREAAAAERARDRWLYEDESNGDKESDDYLYGDDDDA